MKTRTYFRIQLMVLAILSLAITGLWSQAAPLSFRVENVISHVPGPPVITPWMFDLDDPILFTHDGNPFTYKPSPDTDDTHNFAYWDFSSIASPLYTSYCTAENLDYVNGTDGFRIAFSDFTLSGFHKVNTVNPAAAWNIPGQAGDIRTYTNGVCELYHNEALVLRLTDCVLRANVYYPTAAQIHGLAGLSPDNWVTDIGTGQPTEVTAWGTLDLAHSNPVWAATFTNFNAGNRVDFVMSSVDQVIQAQTGLYSFNLDLKKATFPIEHDHANILAPGTYNVQELDFHYTAIEQGGPHGNLNDLTVLEQSHEILGGLPEDVEEAHPKVWQFATTLNSFTADITFDLTGYNFGTSDQWVALRKADHSDTWQIWPNVSYLDENIIRANGVTGFSDWAIGKLGDDTLPVQLSSFNGVVSSTGSVNLNWATQSESELLGFSVFRAETQTLQSSSQVSPLIPATNTSNTSYYSYQDEEVFPDHTYYYWLQILDLEGIAQFYGPVIVLCTIQNTGNETPPLDLKTGIQSIFPNPGYFQSIKLYLEKDLDVSLQVYNLKGQKVKSLYHGNKAQGMHSLIWDGTNELGQDLPSGIYFVTFSAAGKPLGCQKFSLVK